MAKCYVTLFFFFDFATFANIWLLGKFDLIQFATVVFS